MLSKPDTKQRSLTRGVFDIYQTRSGYTAVDNEVQRQILEALAAGDQQLPALMEVTGKSKPTLSATHMKDLLNRELVEELPHPTDGRRKVYHLAGTRIGASDIPVPQLRKAVEAYVSLAPLQGRLPLAAVLEILTSAPTTAAPATLHAQGARLGAVVAASLRVADLADLWMRLVRWFEEQGVAKPLRVDLEAGEVVLAPGPAITGPLPHVAAALAGVVQGVVAALDLGSVRVVGEAQADRFILRQE